MKFKHIFLFFLITLPVCLFSRFLQILCVEDPVTAFFRTGYEVFGNILSAIIIVSCIALAVFSFSCYQKPAYPPKKSGAVAITAILLGIGIGYEILTETFTVAIRIWQITVLDILGIFTAVFFVLYGLKMLISFPLPKLFSIVPALYFIMRLICIFTSISAISLIVDNVITLASHCAILIFMANMSKLMNGIDKEKAFRKVCASALCSVLLCAVDSIPRIFFTLTNRESFVHSGVSSALTVLLCGLFTLSFTLSYFKSIDK